MTTPETALLSILLESPDSIPSAARMLDVDDFTDTVCAEIFAAMLSHTDGNIPVDIVSLSMNALKKNKAAQLRLLGIADLKIYLNSLPYYAAQITETSRHRKVSQLAAELSAHPENSESIIAEIIRISANKFNPAKPLFRPASELITETQSSVRWAISRLIEENSTGQLFGASGGGKTFVALCIALAFITGGQTLGGRQAEAGGVLYHNGEGKNGLIRRIIAGARHHSIDAVDLGNLHISDHTLFFDDITAVHQIIADGRRIATQTGVPIRLIIIDTLARHLCGDENSTRDMSDFIKAVDSIRVAFPGAVALIVHHTGNGDDAKFRSRGSSALKAAMDFEIHCDKGLLTFTKLKDAEPPEPIPFKLLPVQIGTDEDGRPVTSCIVEYGARSQRHREAELTAPERMLLSLCHDYPDTLTGDMRKIYYDKRLESEPDTKPDTMKKAYQRAFDGLLDKGFINIENNQIHVKGTPGQMRDIAGHVPAGGKGDRGTPYIYRVSPVPPPCPGDNDLPIF